MNYAVLDPSYNYGEGEKTMRVNWHLMQGKLMLISSCLHEALMRTKVVEFLIML